MKLWVLKCKIGDLEIYLTPDNAHSVYKKDALKFKTEASCKEYLESMNTFLKFCVSEESCLQDGKD